MTVRFTRQRCKVETTFTIQPNGTYWEEIVLSVDPLYASDAVGLAIEEPAGQDVGGKVAKLTPRVRR